MTRRFNILAILFLLNISQTIGQSISNIDPNYIDTTINIFRDSNYFVNFKTILTTENEDDHYGLLTFVQKFNGQTKVLVQDTLEFFMPLIKLKDFNNDKVPDLLILYNSSARSVLTFHLYTVDRDNHKLNRVKSFEEINNPEFDSKNNIIISTSLYNKVGYSFFRIGKDNSVIDLGNSFESELTDEGDKKYNDAIKNILKNGK